MILLGHNLVGKPIEVASDDDVVEVNWDVAQPGLVYHEFKLRDGRRVEIHEGDITVEGWRLAREKRRPPS